MLPLGGKVVWLVQARHGGRSRYSEYWLGSRELWKVSGEPMVQASGAVLGVFCVRECEPWGRSQLGL